MEHKQFPAPGGAIHYWVSGGNPSAQWLVFLPGLSADHRLFGKQLEYFSRRYNCLVWDAPAHGQSRPFPMNFTMADMADWLHEILRQEGVEKPVLVGQSLGGYIAQVYMDRHPDFVSGFVSIDSCSMSRKYYSWWELALLKRTKWMYLAIPWKLLLKWGIWGTAETKYGRQLMTDMWADYDRQGFCDLADFGYRILAQAVEAKPEYTITCPVLLLCGKKDKAGSAKDYNRRWTKVDGHPLVWLERSGHNSNTDEPERVNALIEDFLKKLS